MRGRALGSHAAAPGQPDEGAVVDLGLSGRVVYLCDPSEAALSVCGAVLAAEGVDVTTDAAAADIVLAAARRSPGSDLLEVDDVEQLMVVWADLTVAVEAYRAALPGMVDRGWGRLIWIGSAQARSIDGDEDELGAVVSLGALGLHKVLTAEAGRHGVTANAVLRGEPAGERDVAAAVAFLCSEGAAYLSGVTITVDGGVGSAVF